jgi:hypothetical protein
MRSAYEYYSNGECGLPILSIVFLNVVSRYAKNNNTETHVSVFEIR